MNSDWGLKGKALKKLERDLRQFGKKEFAVINGMALNKTAIEARKEYVRVAELRFIMRNKWTVRSIQFQKVSGFKNQFSEVGSIMDYMEDQEFGETKTKTGKHGVAIPSRMASNEAQGTAPRRKRVLRSRLRSNLRLHKSRKKKTKSRVQHVVAIVRATARAGGRRFIYLPKLGKMGEGIYLITGGKRKPKVNLIYDLSKTSVKIPKQPTLKPAVDGIRPKMPVYYREAFEKRIKKIM